MRCPQCGGALAYYPQTKTVCQECKAEYFQEAGIWRMLTAQQSLQYRPFTEHYRPLRQAEGWERAELDYYLNLPRVKSDDPQAAIWRIRQRSLRRLEKLAGPGLERWALDLGAGNGWLSRQLTKMGYRVVALDLNSAGADSLEGGQVYLDHENLWFGRVQASMEYLPFQDEVFALCTVSGAVHYAPLEPTLKAIWNKLANGGKFIITDSPVYTQAEAGQAMATGFRTRAKTLYGQEVNWPGGTGFLVEKDLLDKMQRQGFEVEVYSIERPLGRLKRQILGGLQPVKREEAHFPVIIGRKVDRTN
jgi:SAM-dependent methyltransferase